MQKNRGVTLLEVLLVLAISAAILLMLINYVQRKGEDVRRSQTSVQMQAIMNAALAYYIANTKWPTSIQDLQTEGYLPDIALNNPWGEPYLVNTSDLDSNLGFLYVHTDVHSTISAQLIAASLPLAHEQSDSTEVVAVVNVPAQSLNQARAVQFAGVYNNGGCVPVPTCPDKLKPQIYAVPAEVYGVFNKPNCTGPNRYDCRNVSVTPITQLAAYAKGPVELSGGGQLQNCYNTNTSACKKDRSGNMIHSGEYWRVCLSVTSLNGRVNPDAEAWGKLVGSIVAMTRCVATNDSGAVVEPTGSNFSVWWY